MFYDLLNVGANVAQILGFIYTLAFGAKTLFKLYQWWRRQRLLPHLCTACC